MATVLDIETPHGPARAHLTKVRGAAGAVVLGHGAGGGVGAPDLVIAAEVAQAEKLSVALVEQPYRVAGRRSPAPANQLDAAWTAVVEQLRQREEAGLPLVLGGRSSGARVACRTAEPLDAEGKAGHLARRETPPQPAFCLVAECSAGREPETRFDNQARRIVAHLLAHGGELGAIHGRPHLGREMHEHRAQLIFPE